MQSNEPADFIAFLVGVLALIASNDVAALWGPYAGITLSAFAGAGLALNSNDEEMKSWTSIRYVLVRAGVAVVLSVTLAKGLQHFWPNADGRILVTPIAFLIGFIKDYQQMRLWFVRGWTMLRSVKVQLGDAKGPNDNP